MTVAHTLAVALRGIDGELVEVQADISPGLPGMSFTGLADAAVVEARDRIRAALLNSGAAWPDRRITVALLPADVRKIGSRFDLAMAVAVLIAAGTASHVPAATADRAGPDGCAWIAELGLDGELRPVRGVLPSVLAARRAGIGRVVVAASNAAEAALVGGIDVRGLPDLRAVIGWLSGQAPPPPRAIAAPATPGAQSLLDLADVAGQTAAKRALEVSAAGNHHLYMVGSPGAGKTMLAQRLPSLLPPLEDDAALEVSAVHSVAGAMGRDAQLVRRAPMQSPHHSASVAALVGGGSGLAAPGAISLAHHGILFLDEAPQFAPSTLDSLRQPLEAGRVVLHRSGGVVSYPARFLLVLAANPCPCGARDRDCTCTPHTRRRYLQRISGPLLDRVDLRVQVEAVPHATLLHDGEVRETSAVVARRVAQARGAAGERWRSLGIAANSEVPGTALRSERWRLGRSVLAAAESYLERGELSARGFDRVLRLAWTVADLEGHSAPDAADVSEAIYLRTGLVNSWAA
ncbi:magnesium chelatase family protein [Jatrophihabitans sp. GAS493]|uniref:YifB family Mg chelatase-like AAA ATPase n=1 Tax=Jatrophihabitans sp. GAS493 TaxID=1907575 RepID=UPI000BB8F6F9|nr:YifB family Mg chelatase-like AAA ATPase [Jatrophihabitans sp. GAS493]SOD74196.1 magnesium chelatase family protein [Jatrophihabitans sp. GAS493]